jgi:uncharacterized protein YciI
LKVEPWPKLSASVGETILYNSQFQFARKRGHQNLQLLTAGREPAIESERSQRFPTGSQKFKIAVCQQQRTYSKGKPMKLRLIVTLIIICAGIAAAQPQAEHRLIQFQMAVLKKGPKWNVTSETERTAILKQHVGNVVSLLDSGKAVIAGPFHDDTDLAGIFILRAASTDEARAWVDADPAVKAGLMTAEMHPWWSQDIFRKAASPLKLDLVYFGFLKRGPNRKDGDGETAEIQELQKAHLANINRLAEMKKLVVAGPFGDDGDLRGIFVFRVRSMKEAEELAATDPMIKIDRLRLELHPWNVPDGVIP